MLNEDHAILRDTARAWVSDHAPVAALRRLRDAGRWATGYDPAHWAAMADMGWAGVVIPEDHGGAAFGYRGLGLVLEETGRTLAASPLHSTTSAAAALVLGGSIAQQQAYLPRIATGALVAALAVDETAHHAPENLGMEAVRDDDGFVLNGVKRFIPDGAGAGLIVVAARAEGSVRLFLVERGTAGLTATSLRAIDSRAAADLAFAGVRVGHDAMLGGDAALLDSVLDRARATLAAEMLGTASQAFDITLDYLKTRTQFGQVIGTFQALQHRAAKMFTELELTRSAVQAALDAIDSDDGDIAQLASLAKARANDTLHLVSNEMVQLHGGIGMTDAFDAGLYLKRARVAEALYGSSSYHRDRYARMGGY